MADNSSRKMFTTLINDLIHCTEDDYEYISLHSGENKYFALVFWTNNFNQNEIISNITDIYISEKQIIVIYEDNNIYRTAIIKLDEIARYDIIEGGEKVEIPVIMSIN